MHVIKLDGYNATVENGEKLELGTFDSFGEEQLQIVKAPNWANLSVIATFNPPNRKPVQAVVDSVTGVIKVPKEATAGWYGVGTIVFIGFADGVQRISSDVEYIVRRHSNTSGTEPAEPTPDLLQQVLTLSKNAEDADNGKFIGPVGPEGPAGKDGVQIDDAAVSEDAPWSSKHIIDMLCPPLEESGNPVVCYPVAGYALGVKAKWEPMQEGSGTPYPAGGGKNLFNPAWMPEKEVNHGVTWATATDGTVTANGTADGTTYYNSSIFSLPAGTYTISAMSHFRVSILNNDTDDTITAQNVGQPCTFTVENDIQNAHLFFATSGTLDNVSAKPQIEKGSAATAYAPYENIRPIKGRDSVRVERCGENLLNISQLKLNGYNLAGSNTLKPNTTYTFKPVSCGGIAFAVFLTDNIVPNQTTKQLNLTGNYINEGSSATFTTPSNADSYSVMWLAGGKSGIDQVYPNVQFMLVAGTTAPTTYKPYIGQTNTLTLPETVYGGEVDAVNGDGQDTWKLVILNGTESWNTWGLNAQNPAITGFYKYDIKDYDAKNAKGICSHLETPNQDVWGGRNAGIGFATVGSSRYFMFSMLTSSLPDISAGHEVASLKAYLAAQNDAGTPVQIAYKLAEPVPFTATGAQPIPALAGANTILTDADAVEVTGRADPIKRITDLEAAVASIN